MKTTHVSPAILGLLAITVGIGACAPRTTPEPVTLPTEPVTTSAPVQFSNPTEITHPLFPVSIIDQALYGGSLDGAAQRIETTLMPETRRIDLPGGPVEARVVQFVAYVDGRLREVAYDYFAQADDGSVYYLGEDVSNYDQGLLINHEGSWLAGQAGAPPAVIMPADPTVGLIFNPENLPGVVFETDEVVSRSESASTPNGAISDGLLIRETLMDGSVEHKVYAPGYGIVEERSDGELNQLIWANRVDTAPGQVPDPLYVIEQEAEAIFDATATGDWARVDTGVAAIRQARGSVSPTTAPPALIDAIDSAFGRLAAAATDRDQPAVRQAVNDVSAAVLDLFFVYRPALPVDLGRLDVLERQIRLDSAAGDWALAADHGAQLQAVWDRLRGHVLAVQGEPVAERYAAHLSTLNQALTAHDGPGSGAAASEGLELVDQLEALFRS